MALKTKTIPLSEPIIDHGGPVHAIVLRAPTLSEYGRIGEPFTVRIGPDDKPVVIEHDDAIVRYMEILITTPSDMGLAEKIDLSDSIAVKEGILDFFAEARQDLMSRASPTSSS